MSNYSDQILLSLLKLGEQMDSVKIIQLFGREVIDQQNFICLMNDFNNEIPEAEVQNFYLLTLMQYEASSISASILDELLGQAKQIAKTKQQNITIRSPNEIIQIIKKTLSEFNEDIENIFMGFDEDNDNFLNENEFQNFLEFYVTTLYPSEYEQLKNKYSFQKVSLQDLKVWMQESISLNKKIQVVQQTFIDDLQQIEKKQIKHRAINHIIETNLYEDPRNANLLRSNIQFQKCSPIDQSMPGVQVFLQKFSETTKNRQIFYDLEFPANAESLGSKLKQYQWQRLRFIWPKYEIFVKGSTQQRLGLGKWISPQDIYQGELGDCYFLSVLSSMACRWPDILLDLFLTQTKNPYSLYSVKLCIDGIWKVIILDDYIPTKRYQPAFSSSFSKEIWVLLLEKAWAKSFGCYTNIIAGDSTEVIHSLTGGPTWVVNTSQIDFKEQLILYVQRKYLMTTGTFVKSHNSEQMGLVNNHSYSILKIRIIQHPSKGEVTLIKLRNPWGMKEWQGEWSHDSLSWTTELKQQLRVSQKAENGIFYMSYEDFVRHFQTLQVGYFQKNYIYKSQTIVSKNNKSIYFSFNINEPGQYYFTAHQKSLRHFKSSNSKYQYSTIRMILAQSTDNGYIWRQAKQDQYQQVFLGELFKKGDYVLQVKIKWLNQNQNQFVISSYGPKEIKLKEIQKDPNFFSQVLLSLAKQNPDVQQDKWLNLQITASNEEQYGIGYEYYKNTSKEIIEVQSTFQQMIGLKLKKPERGNEYKIKLNPYSEQLIAYTSQKMESQIQQSRSFNVIKS